ncbi:hypothetical protein [Mariniradius sediminis]|uniref:CopG family transcriptional regulator n=1 Tax=Mariniradius sediminis TaxID=2909237 RepID=A0ABS9BPU8_9BACT|nr:hypothetical protein [Mariniradius sediminis]MCF1749532.1 hypothetical protein [Mariniradius sediminis]
MEKININVSDELAKKWAKTSGAQKAKIEKFLEASVSDLLFKINQKNFDELLEKAREEAERNGLSEEILEKILNED